MATFATGRMPVPGWHRVRGGSYLDKKISGRLEIIAVVRGGRGSWAYKLPLGDGTVIEKTGFADVNQAKAEAELGVEQHKIVERLEKARRQESFVPVDTEGNVPSIEQDERETMAKKKRGAPSKKCVKCGTEMHARKSECPKCGAKQPAPKKKQVAVAAAVAAAAAPVAARIAEGQYKEGLATLVEAVKLMGVANAREALDLLEDVHDSTI